MEAKSVLECNFDNYQSGCWLDSFLARCDRTSAVYYLDTELTFSTGAGTKENEELDRRNGQIRSAFFEVNRVRKGIMLRRHRLFLKITLQDIDIPHIEAETMKSIAKRAPCKTPNIVDTELILWWSDETHRLTAIMTGLGVGFKQQLEAFLNTCTDQRDKSRMLLASLFQLLHGLVTLHCMHFQHRDLKIENVIGIKTANAQSPYHQYLIAGSYFRVPLACSSSDLVLWPKWIDFGLTGNIEREDDVTGCLNNIDCMLPPNFVFFCSTDEPIYHNSDDYFSSALAICYILFQEFDLGDIDGGIVKHVAGFYRWQKEFGSEALRYHIEPRNLMTLAKQAFRLVLFLGFPEKAEWPHFYRSRVGAYMGTNIRSYIEEMPGYNFLQKRINDPTYPLKKPLVILQSLLRWNREARPASGKELLLRDEFAEFRCSTADTTLPVYDWNNWNS